MVKRVNAGVLDVAYEESGPATGAPAILLHGFPYDIRAYDEVAVILAAAGRRVLVPYLRGYGPTAFLKAGTPRSGQQAVLAADLIAFMDALEIRRRSWRDTTGAAAPPASWLRSGQSAPRAS